MADKILMNAYYEEFISCAKIAKQCLNRMSYTWEELEFEYGGVITKFQEDYPLSKSFDEFANDFSNWVDNFAD